MTDTIRSIEVLRQAQRFTCAVEVLSSCGKMDAAIPAEVNACTACELYLKYLRCFEKSDMTTVSEITQNRHELHTLYDRLDDDIKKEIISKMKLDENIFSDKLKKIQNNCVDLRYVYQKDKITSSFGFMVKLMHILDDICEEKENERIDLMLKERSSGQ